MSAASGHEYSSHITQLPETERSTMGDDDMIVNRNFQCFTDTDQSPGEFNVLPTGAGVPRGMIMRKKQSRRSRCKRVLNNFSDRNLHLVCRSKPDPLIKDRVGLVIEKNHPHLLFGELRHPRLEIGDQTGTAGMNFTQER